MAIAVEVERWLAAKFVALYLDSKARSLGHGGTAEVARSAPA